MHADNKEVIEAAKAALDSHGNGLASVRFICGTQDIHKALEAKISTFHGTEVAPCRCQPSSVARAAQ